MNETDKYEIPTDEELQGMNQQEFLIHTTKLLAEVKRLREKNEKLHSRCMHLENLLEEWQGAYE